MIWINNIQLPMPDLGLKVLRTQLVDAGRNAQGQVVAQKINRRLLKLEPLKWSYLPASTWSTILQEIEKFEGVLKLWDTRTNAFVEMQVYWGDASDEPWHINTSTGEILDYRNCQCNVIDMGY